MGVLVTGGAGYIGSHVVLALLERGEAVVVLDNLSTGFRRLVPEQASFVLGDVGDVALLNRLILEHGIDSIMHFAGSVVVPESVANPLAYYFNNTVKSHALIQAALRNDIRKFIFSSSAAVYGTPVSNPVTEDATLKPISPYGSSKMMTETMLADVSRASELRYMALRYFNVAGADPQGRGGQSSAVATHLIKVACEVVCGRRPHLEIFGINYPTSDGTCIRDYIHVTDLAQAHVNALSWLREGRGSLVVNCGYGRGYSVLEVVGAMKRVSGTDFKVVFGPRRAGDPPSLVAAVGLIGETLGWKPRFNDLELIANHALTWERTLEQ
jgi:UDP-glucose 4-epimerase